MQRKMLTALLRLDVLTIIVMPMFYFLYAGFFGAMYRSRLSISALSTALAFVGVTLVLGSASVLSLLHLSNQYAAATTDARKTLLRRPERP